MKLSWNELGSHKVDTNVDSFWRAIDVWWVKPHVVNRRLSAAVEEQRITFPSGSVYDISPGVSAGMSGEIADAGFSSPNEKAWQWIHSLCKSLCGINYGENTEISRTIKECIEHHVLTLKKTENLAIFLEKSLQNERDSKDIENESTKHVCNNYGNCEVRIRKLLHKGVGCLVTYEIGVFDYLTSEATFILLVPTESHDLEEGTLDVSTKIVCVSYKFTYLIDSSCGIALSVCEDYLSYDGDQVSAPSSVSSSQSSESSQVSTTSSSSSSSSSQRSVPSLKWLKKSLLPKIGKWAEEDLPSQNASQQQLPLVPMDRYAELYQEMKEKYGAKFVKLWPENTDPKKFVYEDVAIATYLLLLFEEESRASGNLGNERKQSFVDLGCGNGLLVHILNSEGYPGKGIDLRRRKIWDLYGPETCLDVGTIIPSMETSYVDYDWLIGNHSDELTPWIPVMAARSSYTTRYFVLPCCFHDFDRKFSQRKSGESQYSTYLSFVREVGEVCGFEVREDRLRIPSTKRVCHVGKQRTYPEEDHSKALQRIESYVADRCGKQVRKGRSGNKVAPDDISTQQSLLIDISDSDSPSRDNSHVSHQHPQQHQHPDHGDHHQQQQQQHIPDSEETECHQSEVSGSRTFSVGGAMCTSDDTSRTSCADGNGQSNCKCQIMHDSISCSSKAVIPDTHSDNQLSDDASTTEMHQVLDKLGVTVPKMLAPGFKPRDVEEKVRNCSLVDQSLTNRITLDIAWAILEAGGVKRKDCGEGLEVQEGEDGDDRPAKSAKLWRKGGYINLGDAAKMFDRDTLKKLKNECGGLKTLLKNHNQVFQIMGNTVELKDWNLSPDESYNHPHHGKNNSKMSIQELQKREEEKKLLLKTKLCWFYSHHPDGCPRVSDACSFAHGEVELRSRPSFGKHKRDDK